MLKLPTICLTLALAFCAAISSLAESADALVSSVDVDGIRLEIAKTNKHGQLSIFGRTCQYGFFSQPFLAKRGSSLWGQLELQGHLHQRPFYVKQVYVSDMEEPTPIRLYAPCIGNWGTSFQIIDREGKISWKAELLGTNNRSCVENGFLTPLPGLQLVWRDLCGIAILQQEPASWKALSSAEQGAVLDWVYLGGCLFLDGEGSKDAVRDIMAGSSPAIFSALDYSKDSANYGRGRIVTSGSFDRYASNEVSTNALLGEMPRSHASPLSPSWKVRQMPPLPFVVVVVLFALLIGPFAVVLAHKMKRPALTLIIIPALSLLACLALALVALLGDGVTPKLCKQSVSYLDQRTGKTYTQEIFGVEAPVGLLTAPVLPEDSLIVARSEDLNGGCFVAFYGKLQLSGMALPRTPLMIRSAKYVVRKERLEITEKAGQVIAKNQLGTAISNIKLRDAKGDGWIYEGSIAPGAEAPLVRSSKLGTCYAGFRKLRIADVSVKSEAQLAPGCYQVDLASDVFGDAFLAGKSRTVGDSFHILVGRY